MGIVSTCTELAMMPEVGEGKRVRNKLSGKKQVHSGLGRALDECW